MKLGVKNLATSPFSDNVKKTLTFELEKCNEADSKVLVHLLHNILSDDGTDGKRPVKLMREVGTHLKITEHSVSKEMIAIICKMFVFCTPKHPCKKPLKNILQCSAFDEETVAEALKADLRSLLIVSTYEAFHSDPSAVVQTIEICCDQFPTAKPVLLTMCSTVISHVTELLSHHRSAVQLSASSHESCLKHHFYISDCLKCLNMLIQKCVLPAHIKWSSSKHSEAIAQHILNECFSILLEGGLKGDCWNAAGLLLSSVMRMINSPDNYLEEVGHVFAVGEMTDKSLLPYNQLDNVAHLALCNGMLLSLSQCDSVQTTSDKPPDEVDLHHRTWRLLRKAFSYLQQLHGRQKTVEAEYAFSRCILQWLLTSRVLNERSPVDVDFLRSVVSWIIPYIKVTLDHPADVLRHQAREIMSNILLNITSSNEGASFVKDVTREVLSWNWHSRAVFISLTCCLHFTSVELVTSEQPDIIGRSLAGMADQSLAPFSANLYLSLVSRCMKSNENNGHLIEKYLKPVLSTLQSCGKQQSRLIVDNCLKKLLKLFGQEGMSYIASCVKRPCSDGEHGTPAGGSLHVLMMCLRVVQQLNLSDNKRSDPDKCSWNYGIDENTLKSALVHQNDQLRLDAFSIICERSKPTSHVTAREVDLVMFALPFNMTCQCPAFRQLLLNSLKKLLDRVKINYQKLAKKIERVTSEDDVQHLKTFQGFISWLVTFVFEQMFPGACFSRRSLSLHLLKLVVELLISVPGLFTNIESFLSSERLNKVLEFLRDPFDENRSLALELLTSHSLKLAVASGLGEHKLTEMYDSCMETCRTSCKPEQCNDAAFHLRFFVRVSVDVSQQAYRICNSLLSRLEEDVDLAERNLLQVAAARPLFGSLHCIRMLLSEADTRKLSEDLASCQQFLLRCIDCCFRVSRVVMPVIGSVSPEGHLPELTSDELENTEDAWNQLPIHLRPLVTDSQRVASDERLAAQRVLVSCWRSAKQSSLLLQLIASRFHCDTPSADHQAALSWQQGETADVLNALQSSESLFELSTQCETRSPGVMVQKLDSAEHIIMLEYAKEILPFLTKRMELLDIGHHLRRQLMEARHRGAFEIAYSAFKAFCPLLWRSEHGQLSSCPREWLQSMLGDICDPTRAQTLCATRRSAGLPFLAQALLGSDKGRESRDQLHHVMSSLLSVASRGISDDCVDKVSEVHALNVLRGLVRDASLGEEILPFLSQCVMVAIAGFASNVWALRNSSTLFFSALMTRIFGVKREADLESSAKNRLSYHEFCTRLPKLQDFLLEHLEVNASTANAATVLKRHASLFPVLLMLSRVYPSSAQALSPNSIPDKFITCLMSCAGSPIWKVRAMAATALASLSKVDDCVARLSLVIASLGSYKSHNELHGMLLQVQRLHSKLLDHSSTAVAVSRSREILTTILRNCKPLASACHVTRSAFVNLLLQVLRSAMQDGTGNLVDQERSAVHQTVQDLLYEYSASNTDLATGQPGLAMIYSSIATLTVIAFLWNVTTGQETKEILTRGQADLGDAAVRTIRDQLESGTSKHRVLPLCPELLNLARKEKSSRRLTPVLDVLAHLVSAENVASHYDALRHLEDRPLSTDVLGSLAGHQSACLACAILEQDSRARHLAAAWLRSAKRVFLSSHDDVTVRQKAAESLRRLPVSVLTNETRHLLPDEALFDIWRVLISMLVDEDELVRRSASHVVHAVALKCDRGFGEPSVDTFALELAVECLTQIPAVDAARRWTSILDDVIETNATVQEPCDGGGRESHVFDRGESNIYIERHLLRKMAARFQQLAA